MKTIRNTTSKSAILELIKNSYDADARKVVLKLESIDNPKKGVIDIGLWGNMWHFLSFYLILKLTSLYIFMKIFFFIN